MLEGVRCCQTHLLGVVVSRGLHVHCMYAFVELVLLYTFSGLPDSFSPSVEDDLLWPILAHSLLPWHLWNGPVQIEETLVGGVEGCGQIIIPRFITITRRERGWCCRKWVVSDSNNEASGFYSAYA